MQNSKRYKVQFYSIAASGHTIPECKIAELLVDNMSNIDVKFISFQLLRERLSKQFKTVNFEFLYPEFKDEERRKLESGDLEKRFANNFSYFEDYLENRKDLPDLIIADMQSVAPMNFAKKHNIPYIVIFPTSYGAILQLYSFISLKRSLNIEGFLINTPLPKHPIVDIFDAAVEASRGYGRSLFLSFVGLEEPCILPSNHTLVGLLPIRKYSELTPELSQWIEGWKSKGKNKFLYVAFGSDVKLSFNLAKKLAEEFIKLGYPTIWSLRAPRAEQIQDPLIFHRPWLPQEAILRLPEVRGFMTHCGWGSTSEAIMSKTPLICVPGFADQPDNAQLISKRNIGVIIYQTDNLLVPDELQIDISSQRIQFGVREVLEDEKYFNSIKRLNKMSNLHHTTQKICNIVTEALEFGNAHLMHPLTEEVTIKTGSPLSKIIKEQFLPKTYNDYHY